MASPLIFDLDDVELADGRRVRCEVRIVVQLFVNRIPAGDRSAFIEDHLKPVVRRLVEKLSDPWEWKAAMDAGDAASEDEDGPEHES